MKNEMRVALASLLFLTMLLRAEENKTADYQPRMDKDGYEILFDGNDVNAWDPAEGVWVITDQGELHPSKPGRSLFSKIRYCDFVLELDYKLGGQKKANSGVFVHVHDKNQEVNTGMEIQILDNADYKVGWDAMNANGALYDLVHPSEDVNKPIGEWNHYKITLNGSLLTVELNDKEIVKADLSQWTMPGKNPDGKHNKFPNAIAALPSEGFIGLQNYGATPVWFKNVRLKTLTDRKPKFTGHEPIKDVLTVLKEK